MPLKNSPMENDTKTETFTKNLRRSERLKAKMLDGRQEPECLNDMGENQTRNQKIVSKSDIITTNRQNHDLRKNVSMRSSNTEIRRNQIEFEIARKKKELQYRHEQEMLDLELAMKMAKIDEEEEAAGNFESIELESDKNHGPNVKKWIAGQCPWEDRSDYSSNSSSKKKKPTNRSGFQSSHHIKQGEVMVSQPFAKCTKFENDKFIQNIPNNSCVLPTSQLTRILTRQSMPKDLPIFSGNPLEWSSFIFQYNNSTAICGYSSEENLCRLQKCLKGNAKKIVESLLILPKNVDRIIQMLQNRFGRSEHIISLLLDKVKSFPVIKEDKIDMFIDFSDEVQNLVGTIESLNEEDHLRNPILLQELLNKLPTSYKLMWIEYLETRPSKNLKLIEFALWLDNKANKISVLQTPKCHNDTTQSNSKLRGYNNKNFTLTTSSSIRDKKDSENKKSVTDKKKCICCNKQLHHLSLCSNFQSLTKDMRWDFVTKNRVCFSCLIPYHSIRECTKKKPCALDNCKKFHHELLHKDEQKINIHENVSGKENFVETVIATNCHISDNNKVLT